MSIRGHSEAAFKTGIEAHLLVNRYQWVAGEGFDRDRAILPKTAHSFICDTQPKEWAKLEPLHAERTAKEMLGDPSKWIDSNGVPATLRHGFTERRYTLDAAYFKAAHELNPELESRWAANRPGLSHQFHFSPRSEKWLRSQWAKRTASAARSTSRLHR